MKPLAAICFALGLLAFFVTADCRWGFLPLHLQGLESGMIVGALACVLGCLAALLATVFAAIALRLNQGTGAQAPRILLTGSALLLLSFAIFFIL